MRKESVWPQYILYSVDDIVRFDDMRQRGVFADDAPFVMFVLGKYGSAEPGSKQDLDVMLGATDHTAYPWATCCFGPNENAVMLAATAAGGHVRLGFENNLQHGRWIASCGQCRPDPPIRSRFRKSPRECLPAQTRYVQRFVRAADFLLRKNNGLLMSFWN